MSPASPAARQSLIGGLLALLLLAAWLGLHIAAVFCWRSLQPFWLAAIVFMMLTWLSVGLFIIGHDAMHGSLVPGHPRLNRLLGSLALLLYANFSFGSLKGKHFAHHTQPGQEDDPDFSINHPRQLWPWYFEFMRRYFGWREVILMTLRIVGYLLFGASLRNSLLFYAAPAMLASLQLFYFGTYLPHRHGEDAFADRHNARSHGFGWLLSLVTCFHFGMHHEHHLYPGTPWWQLPSRRHAAL